ncbi:hypothetical protein B9Z19DRAFT_1123234 [Tuber borchii]|uniref:Uncharacterized protein n=1 Tax=Tuber borchii TaxID=42251 RepID=A0A2T6ZYR9_TUBBO|nr:hypothetical protein B9Z19DRAFT_1123234 [Tuber borchii]
MSANLIPKITNTAQEMALKALSELVDLLCPTHSHELSITHPISSDTLEGYSVMVECGEDDIVWAVQMWANHSFRRIRRSQRISIHSPVPGKAPKIFLRTLKVWEGLVCDDIVKLHRLGELKKDWWEYPVILSQEHKDAIDYYNEGPTNDDPENEIRAIEAGYKASEMSDPTYYPPGHRGSFGSPSAQELDNENEDGQEESLGGKGAE